MSIKNLKENIKGCTICTKHLPLGPRPVVSFSPQSKILIIGQAPGTKVHNSGIPWDDASGKRLREWMNLSDVDFYDTSKIAIVPMGFCYPGRGKSGDLPPRKECAPEWHHRIMAYLPDLQLTLLIGQYAQRYYLQKRIKANLTQTVENFEAYLPDYFPLVHPSPRNQIWMKRNTWFEESVIPVLQKKVKLILAS
ncbi:MAG: uracil-DNA glycosylase family 4 [Saprospiraceae bacterium]|jgi:uracil-DNA glycosylase family 4